MDHAVYIAWAYAGAGIFVAVLSGWIAWDARRVARQLKALEDRGIRRRSAGSPS